MYYYNNSLHHGGTAIVTKDAITCSLEEPAWGISTSPFGGGIQKIDGVVNHKLLHYVHSEQDLPGGNLENYLEYCLQPLGFSNPTALLTTARMSCFGRSLAIGKEDSVEVFATAGIDKNAARAGELPLYREEEEGFTPLGGTINLLVFLSVSLPLGILARSLITLTEAKSALLDELGIPSIESGLTATGTSTDGIIVVMKNSGPLRTDVGTYSELGYLIATATKDAVREALYKESGWPQAGSFSLLRQLRCTSHPLERYAEMVERVHRMTKKEQRELEDALSLWLPLREAFLHQQMRETLYQAQLQDLSKKYPVFKIWQDWF